METIKINSKIKRLRFFFVSLICGFCNSFDLIFLKRTTKGQIKLNTRNIFQSKGMCRKFMITPRTIKVPKPIPTSIISFSRKSSFFFRILVTVKPSPQVYTKNKIIVIIDISKTKIPCFYLNVIILCFILYLLANENISHFCGTEAFLSQTKIKRIIIQKLFKVFISEQSHECSNYYPCL